MDGPRVRDRFKTPEGVYSLSIERPCVQPFQANKPVRLTLCTLPGLQQDELWLLSNVHDSICICRPDELHIDTAYRSFSLTHSGFKGLPVAHAFSPAKDKDGSDTLIGLSDGTVLLLSLRTQLYSNPTTNTKLQMVSTLQPEAGQDTARASAVTWLPKSAGMFAAAFASGSIYLWKKSVLLGEGSSRFQLLSSNKQSPTPFSTLTIAGGGINDLSAAPCGTRLAAACRDGALRLVDVSTGTVVGGFQAYYGSLLCCSFSPDGRYVAAGGEDDLVTVYGLLERWPVWHCQGHSSWVSRVAWDPAMQMNGQGPQQGQGSPSGPEQPPPRLYRLASVGQDTEMCLWDVGPLDADSLAASGAFSSGMRRSTSTANMLGSPARTTAEAVAMHVMGGAPQASMHQRKPSVGKPAGGITPMLPHTEWNILQPTMQHRLHVEPLSDVAFTESSILTADYGGGIRVWARPSADATAREPAASRSPGS